MIRQEHKETGAVAMSVYLRYFKACSIFLCITTVIFQLIYHTILVFSNFYLARWSSESDSAVWNQRLKAEAGVQPYVTAGNGNSSVVVVSNVTTPPSFQVCLCVLNFLSDLNPFIVIYSHACENVIFMAYL